MKKIILSISVLIAMILFAGCSSEKDEAVEIKKPSLENTKWLEYRGDIIITVVFIRQTPKW